jgi:hypothetical protein
MNASRDDRYRQEVAEALVPTERVRLAAKVSAVLGLVGFIWTIVAMSAGSMTVSEGIIFLVGTALATVVSAASLYAASYRTSLGAARLELSLDDS